MQYNSDSTFGIPITYGKLLSKKDNGFVISFNLEHLLIQRLLGGQIFSKERESLTQMVSPSNLSTIFQFPFLTDSPDFAIAQKEFNIIAFIKSPKFEYSENLRVVFWFQRYVIRAEKDDDFIDTPLEHIPLFMALAHKIILTKQGKPIPKDLEDEIKEKTEEIKKSGNPQNYLVSDTFSLSLEDLQKLSDEVIKIPTLWKETKSEFCSFVREKYKNGEYKSLIDAVRKLFNEYSFDDKKWTVKQCYNLLKKLP